MRKSHALRPRNNTDHCESLQPGSASDGIRDNFEKDETCCPEAKTDGKLQAVPFPPVDIPRVLDLVVPLQRAFVLAAKRFARFVQNIVQALADRGFPAVFGVISCLSLA